MRTRNVLYDSGLKSSHACGVPVISVGNLSVGGTGKSPVVSWIVQWLQSRGIRVAVLSRGYGELGHGQNDEALELELRHPNVPHLQHWDRIASARTAEGELDVQVLVLDDAFQHRRIARDLDVVLIDATDPPAARWLLPGGLYREPLSTLRRSGCVILTRADQVLEQDLECLRRLVRRHAPQSMVAEARHQPSSIRFHNEEEMKLNLLEGQRILAFCGIGNPNSYFDSLTRLGAEIVDRRIWPDHHAFNRQDIRSLSEWADSHGDVHMMICTIKDWVKLRLPRIGSLRLGALAIDLEFLSGQQDFERLLTEALASVHQAE